MCLQSKNLLKDSFLNNSVLLTKKQIVDWESFTCNIFKQTNITLMESAGESIVFEILKSFPKCTVLVLCGSGNNGGDGYVLARKLKDLKWEVDICYNINHFKLLTVESQLNMWLWKGDIISLCNLNIFKYGLIIDALFGTGLNRYLDFYYFHFHH